MNRVSVSDIDRARHDMIRSNTLSKIRMPDAVIYPEKESEVKHLVLLANAENWCLINPLWRITNVCHATWSPAKDQDPDPRAMISIDMKRLNRILMINEEDLTIHVQAGITGGDLVREMNSRGVPIGHEPDSIEFSTLGGWIATKASGMKQNKYGNIEGIVKEVHVVSTKGNLWQHSKDDGSSFERVSTGTDLAALIFGSEGSRENLAAAEQKRIRQYNFAIFKNVNRKKIDSTTE